MAQFLKWRCVGSTIKLMTFSSFWLNLQRHGCPGGGDVGSALIISVGKSVWPVGRWPDNECGHH